MKKLCALFLLFIATFSGEVRSSYSEEMARSFRNELYGPARLPAPSVRYNDLACDTASIEADLRRHLQTHDDYVVRVQAYVRAGEAYNLLMARYAGSITREMIQNGRSDKAAKIRAICTEAERLTAQYHLELGDKYMFSGLKWMELVSSRYYLSARKDLLMLLAAAD
ncbi:MAG: hypothetical protein WBB45_20435 [Cyclobacteriaceae bacterium]